MDRHRRRLRPSPMPFGVKSHRDDRAAGMEDLEDSASPMPFGVKSHRDGRE